MSDGSILVSVLGLAFVTGGITIWATTLAPAAESVQQLLYEFVMHTFFGGIILVVGAHLKRSELPLSERRAVLLWCYAGFVLLFALSVWGHIDAIFGGTLSVAFVSDFVVFTSIGGAFGAIAGANWGRAGTNKELAERNQEQRETLALLTRLLSHDIRNDMNIVKGHTERLVDRLPEDKAADLAVIESRTDETIRLVEDVSALVKTLGEEPEFTDIDVSSLLRTEIERLQEEFPGVDVATEIPPGITVHGNNLLHQLFSNLLYNAVLHNDITDLQMRVSVTETGTAATIVIQDNGRGIPAEFRESCFELGTQGSLSEGEGIGLYLVSRLVDLHDGHIELTDSPTGGAEFHITLPRT